MVLTLLLSARTSLDAGAADVNAILASAAAIFPDADQCKRWGGASPRSHRMLGAAVLSNKSCTRYFLKLP